LPLGIASLCEYFIIQVYESIGVDTFKMNFNKAVPKGILVTDVLSSNVKIHDPQNFLNYSNYEVSGFTQKDKITGIIEKRNLIYKEKEIKIKELISIEEITEEKLSFDLCNINTPGIRELLDAIFGDWKTVKTTRIAQYHFEDKKKEDFFKRLQKMNPDC